MTGGYITQSELLLQYYWALQELNREAAAEGPEAAGPKHTGAWLALRDQSSTTSSAL